ncbi:MAG: adventurous gliding motility lipoprotein CglD, partial [Cystobacterineae bacterium]|nr:adventurous gliding motility lipoprotein CglD [Cystobacterineae bacterium]
LCKVGEEGACGEGQECVGEVGKEGVCYPTSVECRVGGESTCGEGQECVPKAAGTTEGTCQGVKRCGSEGACKEGAICLEGVCKVADPSGCKPSCGAGQLCVEGLCYENSNTTDGQWFNNIALPPPREPNPEDSSSDVDCDGIPDWEEMEKVYSNGKKTDPRSRDTDGDGIWDGIELGYVSSPDPLCASYFPSVMLSALKASPNRTDPTRKDSDCDGLSDGDEDKNKNGRFELELGETDPNNVDTDGDGLWDGLELGVTREVAADPENCHNTRYDMCPFSSTDPLNPDTDGDGIWDGVEDTNQNGCVDEGKGELGLGETDPNNPLDIDQETHNACSAENLIPVDIQRDFLTQIALGLPVSFANSYVDIQRGGTSGIMGVDSERNVAFLSWQHTGMPVVTNLVALEALADAHASSLGGFATRNRFASWDAPLGAPNAVSVSFILSGTMSPAARVHAIANTLLGTGSGTLAMGGAAGNTQHVRAQYVLRGNGEVIVVMAVALDNDNVNGSLGFFGLNDVSGGAALARYFDRTVVQCERSVSVRGTVDFLFVVDDSSSMSTSQNRLAETGVAMAAALDNSNLDWRVALVTSSYHLSSGGYENRGIVRGFTRDPLEFRAWLTQNSRCRANTSGAICTETLLRTQGCSCGVGAIPSAWVQPAPACGGPGHGYYGGCWVGLSGSTAEGMLGSARQALLNMSSPTAGSRIQLRENATVIVVILSDAEDQTSSLVTTTATASYWEEIQHFLDFFQGIDTVARTTASSSGAGNPTPIPAIRPGTTIQVNAVYCPAGQNCGDSVIPSAVPTRIQNVVAATGGFLSSIQSQTAIQETMRNIVERAIGSQGVLTQKPLIGASLRVAIGNPERSIEAGGACDGTHVPRSRQHGFDYDGISQTVTFFGDCRPRNRSLVAISYRAWESSDKQQLPCEDDIYFESDDVDYCKGPRMCDAEENVCVCPSDCGGCPQGMRCNSEVRECKCVSVLN